MASQSLCCSHLSSTITCSSSARDVAVIRRYQTTRRLTNPNRLNWVSKLHASKPDSGVHDGEVEPFRGKAGSISFYGVTYNSVEASKLVSSPFKEGRGSVVWVLAPLVLMLSLILPQLFISDTLLCESVFYAGVAVFVVITDWVQKPYLEFSAKRWGLITGLKGHMTTLFFSTGLKIVAPLVITYVTWPILGMEAFTAVAPVLFGFVAQLALETFVERRESSCWPVVPIIFEVYRLYQLTRSAQFVERLMLVMSGAPNTPEVIQRSGALVGMLVTFQALGLVCLWSLLTFLLRLYPSRPVSEKY